MKNEKPKLTMESARQNATEIVMNTMVLPPIKIIDMASLIEIDLKKGEKGLGQIKDEHYSASIALLNAGALTHESPSAQRNFYETAIFRMRKSIESYERTSSGLTIAKELAINIVNEVIGQIQDALIKQKQLENSIEEVVFEGSLNGKQLAYIFFHLQKTYPSLNKTKLGDGLGLIFPNSGDRIRQYLSNPDDVTEQQSLEAVNFVETWAKQMREVHLKRFQQKL